MLVLYSAPGCGPCGQAKSWLSNQGASYEVRDITEPRWGEEWKILIAASKGKEMVPTLVDGKRVVQGFSEQSYQAFLSEVPPWYRPDLVVEQYARTESSIRQLETQLPSGTPQDLEEHRRLVEAFQDLPNRAFAATLYQADPESAGNVWKSLVEIQARSINLADKIARSRNTLPVPAKEEIPTPDDDWSLPELPDFPGLPGLPSIPKDWLFLAAIALGVYFLFARRGSS